MKKFLIIMACVFGILTIVLYFSSLNHLDKSTARYLGTDTTINIQGTVFCAACAIICAINIVGAIIIHFLETNRSSVAYSSGSRYGGIPTDDGGVLTTSGSYWVCPKCKTRNPRSKVECRECGTIRE